MNKLLSTLLAAGAAALLACTSVPASAQKVTGNAENGGKKTAMCMGCHGIIGYQASFPEVYKVPKIAGQSETYIVSALTAYKNADRRHPTMRAIADSLSEQDIADLAAYYSKLGMQEGDAPAPTGKSADEKVQALIARDKDNACTKCHGANFNTPNDGTVPKLAGQYKDYLYVALKSYKIDKHETRGRSNAVMGGQAKRYSNDELKDLADYISSLPGEVKTVPESRFHR